MGRHISPEYLRAGMRMVREMSGGVRTVRRDMWNFLVSSEEKLNGVDMETMKNILGWEMFRRGHNGFSGYARVEIPEEINQRLKSGLRRNK